MINSAKKGGAEGDSLSLDFLFVFMTLMVVMKPASSMKKM
jgi:hypothetical protein